MFTRPEYAVDNIQKLADLTKDQAALVKQTFDKGNADTKAYIIALLGELEAITDGASGADSIGVTPITETGTVDKLQAVLEALATLISTNETDIETKVASLTNTVNANETDIEEKVTALTNTVNTNETDIENKVTTLTNTVNANETDIESKVTSLTNTVNANETDIEGKVSNLAGTGRTTETVKGVNDALNTHKSSGDHDSRYYTETEINAKVSATNGAIASIDGVTNPTGNVDFVAGTGMRVTPDNTGKKITFEVTGEALPGAHAYTHAAGGSDEITPEAIGAATAEEVREPLFITPAISYNSVISIPSDCDPNSQLVDVTAFGRSLKNEANYTKENWTEWTKSAGVVGDATGLEFTADGVANKTAALSTALKVSTKYGLLYTVLSCDLDNSYYVANYLTGSSVVLTKTVGNQKTTFTTQATITNNNFTIVVNAPNTSGKKVKLASTIRIFELSAGSEIETDFNTMTADQLAAKYQYIKGGAVVSTLPVRAKSVGKNLFDGKLESGTLNGTTGQNQALADRVRSVNYIKVEPNTDYTITSSAENYNNAYFFNYDRDKNFLNYVNNRTEKTPSNIGWVKIVVYSLTSNTNVSVQLEKGTIATATPYEPFVSGGEIYTPADWVGRSVGVVKDEFNESTGVKTQNVESVNLGTVNWSYHADSTSTNYWGIKQDVAFGNVYYALDSTLGYMAIFNYNPVSKQSSTYATFKSADSLALYHHNDKTLMIKIPKTDIATTPTNSDVQNWLNTRSVSLNYQLANPKYDYRYAYSLIAYPNGVIICEKVTTDYGRYDTTNGIVISNQTLLIKSLDKVLKIDNNTGAETDITSTCTVKSDGTGITSTALVDGDLAWLAYYYDESLSTNPGITYTYGANLRAMAVVTADTANKAFQQANKDAQMHEYHTVPQESPHIYKDRTLTSTYRLVVIDGQAYLEVVSL